MKLGVLTWSASSAATLAGAGWAEYEAHGTLNGAKLRSGLRPAERLPEPMFTPSTKAEEGHDLPLTEFEAIELVGRRIARTVEKREHRDLRTRPTARRGSRHDPSRHQIRVWVS